MIDSSAGAQGVRKTIVYQVTTRKIAALQISDSPFRAANKSVQMKMYQIRSGRSIVVWRVALFASD